MQAKRKLTALLLSLCMLLGMLPMTAFAAGVPAAPTNLKLELTETGLKASWDKPETTGGLDIFEYEVTLYGHFDGTAGEKTKVETKTVQRETTCTFTNTGNAEGVINPTYEVEVRAREGVSGTGDPDNLSGYYVTEWTGWSSSSSASYKTYDISVITSVNKYYTGVVDVGLPGSENKLHQEGITATGNPDVTQPDGTTSENEKQAVTELLYQYFEENKETVPELANVTRDNLMVKTVLERIESSRTVDPNNSLAASGEGTKVLAFSESSDHYGIGADGVEGTITISDGATVTARGGKGAMKSKPDLTGYTNPYIKAGAYTDSATEVTDPANTDYHMNTFVEIKAGETPIDSFTYEINGESVTITGYTGSEGNVTIPSEIDGKPVTAIGERAFSHNYTLTSVAIPRQRNLHRSTSAFYIFAVSLGKRDLCGGKPACLHRGR